jgi:hypothetical protein
MSGLWLRARRPGGNAIVRCSSSHAYTTIWIPAASVKSLRLGWWRLQRCPVREHWSIASPVRDFDRPSAKSAWRASTVTPGSRDFPAFGTARQPLSRRRRHLARDRDRLWPRRQADVAIPDREHSRVRLDAIVCADARETPARDEPQLSGPAAASRLHCSGDCGRPCGAGLRSRRSSHAGVRRAAAETTAITREALWPGPARLAARAKPRRGRYLLPTIGQTR